jgi:hypothetical protein
MFSSGFYGRIQVPGEWNPECTSETILKKKIHYEGDQQKESFLIAIFILRSKSAGKTARS